MKITARTLELRGTGPDQVALFAETFPHGLEPTAESCSAVSEKFDWSWLAHLFLTDKDYQSYLSITSGQRMVVARLVEGSPA